MYRYSTAPFLFFSLLIDFLEVALILRFVFVFFGANATNPFIRDLYALTAPFVGLFGTIFHSSIVRGFTIEWSTLIAMVVYAIAAAAVIRFLDALLVLAEGEADEHVRHHHA